MFITDKFVFLNFPKTGSTFINQTIASIYQKRINDSLIDSLLIKLRIKKYPFKIIYTPHVLLKNYEDNHGGYHLIPQKYKNLEIASIMRNPYKRFLSIYNYMFWKKHPRIEKDLLFKELPNFPDLSLNDYVKYDKLLTDVLKRKFQVPKNVNIGYQSIEYILMFFKEPHQVLKNLTPDYLEKDYSQHEIKYHVLRQEYLNEDLANFIRKYGFKENEINFIKKHERINISKSTEFSQSELDFVIESVNSSEAFLLKILAKKGLIYSGF